MNNGVILFSYGSDLNLSLLHCMVGGTKPLCRGWALLHGFRRTWNTCGHLPGIEPCPTDVTTGAVTVLTRQQLMRLEQCWMVPALYRYIGKKEVRIRGVRRQWARVYAPTKPLHNGFPSFSSWRETCIGAKQRGVPDFAIQELLNARPNDLAPWS